MRGFRRLVQSWCRHLSSRALSPPVSPKPGVAGSSPATPASEGTELESKGVALVQNAGNANPGDWRKTKPLLKWSGSHPRQGLADSGAEVGLGAWGCAR